jgi:hypothetical protein
MIGEKTSARENDRREKVMSRSSPSRDSLELRPAYQAGKSSKCAAWPVNIADLGAGQ